MDEIALEAQGRMNKTIDALRGNLSTLRTGRASPAIVAGVEIDYYGSMTPISQISSITIPEPRQLLIKPYDKNDVKAIVSAINASNLGLNPINEGTVVRLIIPALTQDRRIEITKQAKKYGEEAKVAIRNIRRDYMDLVKEDDIMKHKMHTESYEITKENADIINQAIDEKRRVICVGTTSLRTLEANITKYGEFKSTIEETGIFIYPPYQFKSADALITNFHLPKSTLIMLVSAFSSIDIIKNAYYHAQKEKYKFFSFGDAMFLTDEEEL